SGPSPEVEGLAPSAKPRPANEAAVKELLESAFKLSPACMRGWAFVLQMARDPAVSYKERAYWAGKLDQIAGRQYPDFLFDTVTELIASEPDLKSQEELWDTLARSFAQRPDLRGESMMRKGKMLAKAGSDNTAIECFRGVVDRHINDGSFV